MLREAEIELNFQNDDSCNVIIMISKDKMIP